jgi:hypothetical protein
LGTGFIVHHRIVAAVKTVDFVSDRASYICIVLRGRWCSIIVLNAHAPTEKKRDDSKARFYEELKQISFYHFPKYHMKILLRDFNAKFARGDIVKPATGNERLHQ